jgi:hypothetical protein
LGKLVSLHQQIVSILLIDPLLSFIPHHFLTSEIPSF